jgi:hypothetical protein
LTKARSGKTAVVFWLLAATLLAHRAGAAERASRVALVRTPPGDVLLQEASTRLRAELRDAGFEVVDVESAPGDPRSSVETAAEGDAGFATVSIDRARTEAYADVWISDHLTGKTVVRRVRVRGEKNTAAVLAIRAIELLRASMLESAVPPPDRPVAAPRDVLDWVQPSIDAHAHPRPTKSDFRRGATLGASVLALHGTSGLGFAFGPALRLAHGFGSPFLGRLTVAVPLAGPSLSAPGGTASVRQEFAAVDVAWASGTDPVAAVLAIGGGVFHLHTEGSAEPPNHSRSDDVVSLSANFSAGALVRLGPRLAFSAEATAILLHPEPVVIVAHRVVGAAGAPSVGLSLGIVLAL